MKDSKWLFLPEHALERDWSDIKENIVQDNVKVLPTYHSFLEYLINNKSNFESMKLILPCSKFCTPIVFEPKELFGKEICYQTFQGGYDFGFTLYENLFLRNYHKGPTIFLTDMSLNNNSKERFQNINLKNKNTWYFRTFDIENPSELLNLLNNN